jgi:hypothetical protein
MNLFLNFALEIPLFFVTGFCLESESILAGAVLNSRDGSLSDKPRNCDLSDCG